MIQFLRSELESLKSGKAENADKDGTEDSTFLNSSSDIIVRFDKQCSLQFINNSISRVTGLAPSEYIGKTLHETKFPVEMIDRLTETIDTVFSSGSLQHLELAIDGKDSRFIFDWRFIPEFDEHEKVISVFAIARDITAETAAEEEIARWKNKYENIVASSGQVVYDYDIATGSISWGGNTKEVTGYTAAEMGNVETWGELVHPDDRSKALVGLEPPSDISKPYDAEYRFLHKSGDYLFIRDRGFYIPGADGKAERMQGMMADVTATKLAAIALKESEERYKSLFENSVLGIYLSSPEGKLLMANQELIHMLGFSTFSEMSSHDIGQSGYSDDLYRKFFRDKLEKYEQVKGFESVWKKKDGSLLYVRENAKVFRDTQGVVSYIEGTVEDITNLKFAEEALKESQENLSITLDSIGDAVITTGINGVITRMNIVAERMTGWTKEEALNRRLIDVLKLRNSYSGEAIANPVEKVITEGRIIEMPNHVELISRSGLVYQIADSAAPIRRDNGEVLGVVMVFRDVTEKFNQEKAIRESEEKFRKLTESASMAIMIFQDDKWIYANPAAERITEYAAGELYQMNFWEIFHPDFREFAKEKGIARQKGEEVTPVGELRLVTKSGKDAWIDYAANNIEHKGRPAGLFFFSDATDQKLMNDALRKSEMNNRATLQAIPDLLFRLDKDGNFIDYYTTKVEDLLLPPERIIGANLTEAFPADVAIQAVGKLKECFDTGQIVYFNYQAEIKNQIKFFETRLVKVNDNEVLALAREITTNMIAQQALREQEQYLTDLLNSIADPLFVKDSDHCWVLVNDAFCQMLGKPREMILGKSDPDFFPKNQVEVFWKYDQLVLDTGEENLNEEEITVLKNVRTITTKKMRYVDNMGQRYIVGIIRDITEIKKTEREINKLNTELEQRVIERTNLLQDIIEQLKEEINNRVSTETALADSEDKFRSVVEQSVDGIALIGNDGKVIEWNRGMERISGFRKEEIIGKYQWDVEYSMVPLDKRNTERYERLKQVELDILMNRQIPVKYQNTESVITSRDGKHKHIQVSIFPIKTKETFIIGQFSRDISTQKKFEEALKTSEQQYRNLFENANDAILIIDPADAKIVAANSKAAEVYGYTREELSEMFLKQLTADIDFDLVQVDDVTKGHKLKNFETVHLRRNKEEINMLVNGSFLEYNGKPAVSNSYRDITDLKKAEKARAATFKISQLIHTAQSTEDLYRSVHQIVEELMPAKNFYIALYDVETELLAFPYFVDEHDSPPKPRKLGKGLSEYVLRHGKPFLANQESLEVLRTEGEIEFIGSKSNDWLGVPLKTRDKVIGLVGVQSYSEGVRYSKEEMEMLVFVSEQIAILIHRKQAEDELFRAKEKAEESDRLKSSLLANMSHELRTPMTGILGFASLLSQEMIEPVPKSMALNILASGKRLMTTLNSILSLSQLEANKASIRMVEADLGAKIKPVALSFENAAKQKKLEFKINLTEGMCALIDENFFIQAMSNIVENAVKFTKKGSVTVSNSIVEDDGHKWVVISVKDTGIGIAEENNQVIFKEFRQVSEGHTRSYEGSGLGLSLCKKVIELMNGRITVESELEKGSEFKVWFLAIEKKQADVTEMPAKPEKEAGSAQKEIAKQEKLPLVLLVEDNQINIDLTLIYLKKTARVEYATSGLAGIELAKTKIFDAILMDINLGPGIDGLEATRQIRKITGYEKVPVIALTGYTTFSEKQSLYEGGCTHYLAKPFEGSEITKMLDGIFRQQK
ncbi:MAG: PAS domain S-box protein [Bacteroidota bacterium]